ncbi:MAG: hypothetical protein ACE5JB_16310, partial [bacterium]
NKRRGRKGRREKNIKYKKPLRISARLASLRCINGSIDFILGREVLQVIFKMEKIKFTARKQQYLKTTRM